MSGGGGGGSSQQTSTQVVDLPDWAKPYAKEGLGKAAALTDIDQNPYQQYTGSRQAGFDPMQQQAFRGAAGMTSAPQMGAATGMAADATNRLLNQQYTPTNITNQYQGIAAYAPTQFQNQFQAPSQYQTGQFDPRQVSAGALEQYQMGPAERVGTEKFGTQSAQDYMNPYMQSVVDIQKREAQRQADIAGTQRGAAATKSGAFGGARQAIMEAEAQRNLAQQMGDIQAQGSQAAYDRAAQMFTSDQARQLAAQQANQQAGLTSGQANLQAALGVQSLGAQQGLQAQLANQQQAMEAQRLAEQSRQFGAGQGLSAAQLQAQYGLSAEQAAEASKQFAATQQARQAEMGAQYGQSAQQLREQANQYGAGLGLQGLQSALTGAGQLANIGQQQFGQVMDINKLQQQYGTQRQAQEQAGLDTAYQDFLNQQRYPYQQLEFMNAMLRGTPLGTVSTMYQPAPSALSQLAGLGTAAYGVSKMAKGGEVGYADGGGISGLNPMELDAATDNMSDPQMQQAMGLASISDLAKLQIAQKLAQNGQIRQAAQQAQAAAQPQPQGTIADEALAEMGIGGLDVPDETFSAAGGGIVAFATGGTSLRGLEAEAGIPYGTESEFEKRRKKLEKEAEARRMREKKAADRAKEDKMLPNGGKSDTVLPTTPTTAAIPAAPQLPKEMQTVGGIAGLMTNPEIEANRATADTMSEAAAQGDVIAAQQAEEQYIKDQAALGVRGKEREESLRAQQDELKGKEDKNFNMALIETGLAMMAGTSANPFENIGKAGLIGKKSYEASQEKLQARKDKLNEALYALEDARYSDKKVDAETLRGLKRDVANAKTGVQKVMADTFRKSKVDAPAGVLKSAVETYSANTMAVYGQDSANRRQAMADSAAMDRVQAGKSALTVAGERAYKDFMRNNPDATEEEQLAFINKLSTATYAGGAAKTDALNVKIEDLINTAVQFDQIRVNGMRDGPEKVAAQKRIDERKEQLRKQYRGAGASESAGGGASTEAGGKVIDFNTIK